MPTNTLSRRLIEGPSAWIGADMRGREAEWSYRLSPSEIAEIEAALKLVQARGLDIADIRREDFPLPTLGPVLDRLRAEVLDGRGFVLLRGVPVEDRPIAESAARLLGHRQLFRQRPLAEREGASARTRLRPRRQQRDQSQHPQLCHRRNARTSISIAATSWRCCACGAPRSGGLSAIASSMTVHNVMAARRPDLLERLYQPFPIDRRGEVPEGKAPFYEAPVFNEHAGAVSVLYSRLHIGSSQRFPEARRLTPEDIEALDMLGELAGDPELRLDMDFMPGDIQFLHNHTILHARTGIRGLARGRAQAPSVAAVACAAGRAAAAAGVCRVLRRHHDRRSRRHHLQGNPSARTAGAGLNAPGSRRAAPKRLACSLRRTGSHRWHVDPSTIRYHTDAISSDSPTMNIASSSWPALCWTSPAMTVGAVAEFNSSIFRRLVITRLPP